MTLKGEEMREEWQGFPDLTNDIVVRTLGFIVAS